MGSRKKAIVIGGGFAGKLAARVLSEAYEEVLVLDSDEPCTMQQVRKHTPQGYHAHALLKGGLVALEELFPRITEELLEGGSIHSDFAQCLRWYQDGRWKQPFTSEYMVVQQSRAFLEWQMQKRLEREERIQLHYRVMVTGLTYGGEPLRITGVKVKSGGESTEEITADLVVDAGGYGSKVTQWLGQLGFECPVESVKIDLTYGSRMYRKPPGYTTEWRNLLISPMLPEQPRSGTIVVMEGDRMMVTLGGYMGEAPPLDDEGFLNFAAKLPVPDVYEFMKRAEPLSEIKLHSIPVQVRRRFDRMNSLPEGLLMIGDAMCRFDPLFGQGMSVAAMEAVCLRQCLKQKAEGIGLRFHQAAARIIDQAWAMASAEAYRHPMVPGKRPAGTAFTHWFTKRIFALSAADEKVYMDLIRVMNLTAPATIFFKPRTLVKSLFTK